MANLKVLFIVVDVAMSCTNCCKIRPLSPGQLQVSPAARSKALEDNVVFSANLSTGVVKIDLVLSEFRCYVRIIAISATFTSWLFQMHKVSGHWLFPRPGYYPLRFSSTFRTKPCGPASALVTPGVG
jgi:hypothetical protein